MHRHFQSQRRGNAPAFAAAASKRKTVHELRNLFGIVAAARHLLAVEPERAEKLKLLEAIEEAAIEGGRLTTSLLDGGADQAICQTIAVGARLEALSSMMRTLAMGRSFELKTGMPDGRSRLNASAFDACLLELVANAVTAQARTISVRSGKIGSRVWIFVCDDGCGMNAATLHAARSGLDAGKTHGGGLAHVHDFVRSSHGHIHIDSDLGRGTVIAIDLPAVLSVALVDRHASPANPFLKPKEMYHAKVRQSVAA